MNSTWSGPVQSPGRTVKRMNGRRPQDPSPRRAAMDRVWITLVAIGVVTGTASAVLFLPANSVLAAAIDGVLVAVVAIGVRQSALISMARSDRRAMMHWLRRGVVGGATGAIALAGLFRIFGPAALGIVAVLGLTCPQLWTAVADAGGGGQRGRSRSPSHPSVAATGDAGRHVLQRPVRAAGERAAWSSPEPRHLTT